ncbi:MAG: hypothetical protein MK085_04455 [Phycisphaerales bacterium]|nr:hypothetical protein [Phycisphaerales bacterium]
MPIAHPCNQCGLDLAHVRAVKPPSLGLPVVCCPGCGWGIVRRRGRHAVPWMASWRFGIAALRLALAVGILGFSLYLTMIGIRVVLSVPDELPMIPLVLIMGMVLGLFAGLACSLCLIHIRPIVAWLLWCGTLSGIITLALLTIVLFLLSSGLTGTPWFTDFPDEPNQLVYGGAMIATTLISSLCTTMVVGFFIGLIRARRKAGQWRRLRNKLKERPRP